MTTSVDPKLRGLLLSGRNRQPPVWLHFRFPRSLRMMDGLPAVCSIIVSYETVCQWALELGQSFANQVRRKLPAAGDKWHLNEIVLTIAGVKHGRAVAQIECGKAPKRNAS